MKKSELRLLLKEIVKEALLPPKIKEDEQTQTCSYCKRPLKIELGAPVPGGKRCSTCGHPVSTKKPFQDFDKERVFKGINKGTLKEDDVSKPNPLDGKSNVSAASAVNKVLAQLSKGIFSDQSWEAINKIFQKLKEMGLETTVISAKYGGQNDTSNGMPKYKEWQISIPFTNNKGKPTQLVGQITAHGAGSIEQPLDRYDITAYVNAVAIR